MSQRERVPKEKGGRLPRAKRDADSTPAHSVVFRDPDIESSSFIPDTDTYVLLLTLMASLRLSLSTSAAAGTTDRTNSSGDPSTIKSIFCTQASTCATLIRPSLFTSMSARGE